MNKLHQARPAGLQLDHTVEVSYRCFRLEVSDGPLCGPRALYWATDYWATDYWATDYWATDYWATDC